MIYLLGTSGLVRLLRDQKLQEAWYDAVDAEAIGSCYPQRTEFLYTARGRSEYDEITEMFGDLYPDVSVPKTAGRRIASVQHHMARAGEHRSASAVANETSMQVPDLRALSPASGLAYRQARRRAPGEDIGGEVGPGPHGSVRRAPGQRACPVRPGSAGPGRTRP